VIDVGVGTLADPFPGHLDQLIALAEGNGAVGTGIGAARILALLDTRITHRAPHHSRRDRVVVLVGEYLAVGKLKL